MTFRDLCDAMDDAGVEVLLTDRPSIVLRDWHRLRECEIAAPHGPDRAVMVACLSAALATELGQRPLAAAWPELVALAAAAA